MRDTFCEIVCPGTVPAHVEVVRDLADALALEPFLYYLSLDLRDANFNALIFYDPQLAKVPHLAQSLDFLANERFIDGPSEQKGATSWNGLLREVFNVETPYILNCKEFRSVWRHTPPQR